LEHRSFGVIGAAMREADTVGIGRVTLSRRERPVMIEPRDAGMVLITLRASEEVRTPSFATAGTDIDTDMVAIASMIIKRRSGHFDRRRSGTGIRRRRRANRGEDERPSGQAEGDREAAAGGGLDGRAQTQPGAGNPRGRKARTTQSRRRSPANQPAATCIWKEGKCDARACGGRNRPAAPPESVM
jgi:hypothetical protein